MMQRAIFIFMAITLLVSPTAALGIGAEVAVGGWNQSPEGDIAYESEDTLDLKNDLKYDDEFQVFGRVKLDVPLIPNIYLMATPMEFEGTGRTSEDFRFGDVTFRGNTDFYSKLTLNHYDIALYYGIPLVGLATLNKLNIELGLNVRIVDFKAEIRQDNTHLSESESYTLPIPMVYAGIQIRPIESLSIEAEARGVTYSGNHVYSLIGRLKANILGPAFIAGGYRYENIIFDEEDIKADTCFMGPFLEAGFEF